MVIRRGRAMHKIGRAHALGLAAVVGALLAAACASPEATRVRQGGPGGDVGNRGERVEFHGRTNPDFDVQRVGLGAEIAGQNLPQAQASPGVRR